MKKEIKVLLIKLLISAILIASIAIPTYLYKKERNERRRYQSNNSALVKGISIYKTKSDKDVYVLQQENLSLNEIKNSQDSIIQAWYLKYKDSGRKNKDLHHIIYLLRQAKGGGVVYSTDTVYIVGDEEKAGRTFAFNDGFLNQRMNYFIYNDSAHLSYTYKSGLFGSMILENNRLNWKNKKKFVLWYKLGFGRKNMVFDFQSTNPNEEIISGKNIKIYKRRKKRLKRYL